MDKDFNYKAKNYRGEDISGTVTAKTLRDAAVLLHGQNLIVLEITEKRRADELLNKEFDLRLKPVAADEFSQFCRQFHIMMNAGVSILRCLEIIGDETRNKGFARDIKGICIRIQSGESLSQAMAAYPKSFPELFVFMVAAGEMSGNLTEILLGMAEHYETQEQNRRQLQQVLFYPMILVFTAILVLLFLLTYVLPTFVGMFEAMEAPLPKPTYILLGISQMLTTYWPMIILVAGGSVLLAFMIAEVPKVALSRDYLKTKMPLTGSINQKRSLSMMAKTLAMLLNSGIDLLTALSQLAGITENRYLKKEVVILVKKISEGTSLAQGMEESAAFPSLFCQLVRIGETSGSLPVVLESVNRIYKDEMQNRIQLLSTALEPLILIVLGGMVLFILASVMLPVFDIYSAYSAM
ncbi:hypothetical protein GH808_11745 [Acetobacterium fimetarium]|uniref:Type II secretion system protein GspF domain-containing protein n=1 Tax=Acetobacterium fimetarium TaxID=52691 RepID=A0ABR6WWV6_9FIRM|nr:type II secretion system F family protein [Acetobacterium fimetarium]MBC3805098.1 hypothetical protein [Acetobacterium fimetarium]